MNISYATLRRFGHDPHPRLARAHRHTAAKPSHIAAVMHYLDDREVAAQIGALEPALEDTDVRDCRASLEDASP